MYFRKINNRELWDKIQRLRVLVKYEPEFKERTCWKCGQRLNIYDFLSDNIKFTPEYILKLWQASELEFHCCECFKALKITEIEKIEQEKSERSCFYCNTSMDVYKYSKLHNYLKIHELREIWLDDSQPIFCDNLCARKYYKKRPFSRK